MSYLNNKGQGSIIQTYDVPGTYRFIAPYTGTYQVVCVGGGGAGGNGSNGGATGNKTGYGFGAGGSGATGGPTAGATGTPGTDGVVMIYFNANPGGTFV
jgi:hypothetical protein